MSILPEHKSLLSLAIPTYCRAEILEENLRAMLPELRKYQIPVYVSDDSPDLLTCTMIERMVLEYPKIYYRRNEPSLGHDRNCLSTLAWPDSRYIWYLGDAICIREGGMGAVLSLLESQPDMVFVNSRIPDPGLPTGPVVSVQDFLDNHLWYLTLTGATVYSINTIKTFQSRQPLKIHDNFMQLGIILQSIFSGCTKLVWIQEQLLAHSTKKTSYWTKSALKVFCHDWIALISSFPELLPQERQNRIIKSHSRRTGLFGIKGLLRFRASGALTVGSLRVWWMDFVRASHVPPLPAILVLLLPPPLLRWVDSRIRGKTNLKQGGGK